MTGLQPLMPDRASRIDPLCRRGRLAGLSNPAAGRTVVVERKGALCSTLLTEGPNWLSQLSQAVRKTWR